MLPLTKEELYYICEKRFLKRLKIKRIIEKLETIVISQLNMEVKLKVYVNLDLMCLIKLL